MTFFKTNSDGYLHHIYTLKRFKQNIFDLPVLPFFDNDNVFLIKYSVPCLLGLLLLIFVGKLDGFEVNFY